MPVTSTTSSFSVEIDKLTNFKLFCSPGLSFFSSEDASLAVGPQKCLFGTLDSLEVLFKGHTLVTGTLRRQMISLFKP